MTLAYSLFLPNRRDDVATAYLCFHAAGVRYQLQDLGLGLLESWSRDVGHQNVGAFFGEEDGCLEADAAAQMG